MSGVNVLEYKHYICSGEYMNRLQQIQKAKSYIDMLSQAIDPTSGDAIEDSILKNKQIKDTFAFISLLLEEIISNGGEVAHLEKPISIQPELINNKAR